MGKPSGRNSRRDLKSVRLCSTVLPKPIPGSIQIRSGRTPARIALSHPFFQVLS